MYMALKGKRENLIQRKRNENLIACSGIKLFTPAPLTASTAVIGQD